MSKLSVQARTRKQETQNITGLTWADFEFIMENSHIALVLKILYFSSLSYMLLYFILQVNQINKWICEFLGTIKHYTQHQKGHTHKLIDKTDHCLQKWVGVGEMGEEDQNGLY